MPLAPKNPEEVLVIRDLNDKITTFSLPFKRVNVVDIGGRMTIIELQSGGLVVFSPVQLTDKIKNYIKDEIAKPVEYLVAPDIEHHVFLTEWHIAYPSAKVIGPHGLAEKRAKQLAKEAQVEFTVVATTAGPLAVDSQFDAEFEVEYIAAHNNREIVLLHKPTNTLIEADLLFALPAREQYEKVEKYRLGMLSKLMVWAFNVDNGVQAWLIDKINRSNPASFADSIARINNWQFDTIIPCHGDVITTNAKAKFSAVMARPLSRHAKKPKAD